MAMLNNQRVHIYIYIYMYWFNLIYIYWRGWFSMAMVVWKVTLDPWNTCNQPKELIWFVFGDWFRRVQMPGMPRMPRMPGLCEQSLFVRPCIMGTQTLTMYPNWLWSVRNGYPSSTDHMGGDDQSETTGSSTLLVKSFRPHVSGWRFGTCFIFPFSWE